MVPLFVRHLAAMTISMIAFINTGCVGTSPPSKYYLLNSITESVEMPKAAADTQALKIGIGPIHLPKYLDRPQIVMRTDDNRTQVSQFDRWAEPLEDNFYRVMTENLALLLNTVYLHTYPWYNRVKVDYQVSVHVYRFDLTAGKEAGLNANWRVLSGSDRSILVQKNSIICRKIGSQEFTQNVAALNATLEDLCREIADTIRSVDQKQQDSIK